MVKCNLKIFKKRLKVMSLFSTILISMLILSGCTSVKEGDLVVTYSIIGSNKEEYVLKDYSIKVGEDVSVYEGLAKVCKENKIPLSTKGNGGLAYVEGINSIFEFDEGPESGWIYQVNEDFPEKGAGNVSLSDGDIVKWMYTKEMGKDWK